MPETFCENRRRQPAAEECALGLWVDRIGSHPDATTWFRAYRILGLHALCAVVAGHGTLRSAAGPAVALRQGDAWWVPPESALNYGSTPGTRWSHIAIVFAGPLADALAAGLRPRSLVAPGAGPAVEEAWRRLTPLMQLTGASAAAARLAAVATACARFGASGGVEDPRLTAAVALLARHGTGALDVGALARRVGLGASQLRRLFATRYRCSPAAWLVRHRLERARELLAATDLPVGAVSEACGFADPFWFSRLFRREVGASPAVWRGKAQAAAGSR